MTPFEIMAQLKAAKIHFTITSVRDDALMFQAVVPGERWEIEVYADGSIDVERFHSDGSLFQDAATLDKIISDFTD